MYSGYSAKQDRQAAEKKAEQDRRQKEREDEMAARKRAAERRLAEIRKNGGKTGTDKRPPLEDTKLKSLFEAAQQYEQDNPDAFPEIVKRYEEISLASELDSPYYAKSMSELKRLRAITAAERVKEMVKLEELAAPFIRSNDFARAIGVFQEYTGPYADGTSEQRMARVAELQARQSESKISSRQNEREIEILADIVARSLVRMEFSTAKKQVSEAVRRSPALSGSTQFRHLRDVTGTCAKLNHIIATAFEATKGREITVGFEGGREKLQVSSINGSVIYGMKLVIIGESKGRVKRQFSASDLSTAELYKRVSESRKSQPGYAVLLGVFAAKSGKRDRAKQHFHEAEAFLADALTFFINGTGDVYQKEAGKIYLSILQQAKISQGALANMMAAVRLLNLDVVARKNLSEDVSRFNRRYIDSKIAKGNVSFLKALERQLEVLSKPPLTEVQISAMIAALRRAANGTKIDYRVTPVGGSIALILQGNRTLSNIRALAGRPIIQLDLSGTRVSDLSPLSDLPLYALKLARTRVTSLQSVRNLGLSSLDISETEVKDLKYLSSMPLTNLNLSETPVTSLNSLTKLPLVSLNLAGCTKISSLEPLQNIPTLKTLVLPADEKLYGVARTLKSLSSIGRSQGKRTSPYHFWRAYDKTRAAKFEADYRIKVRAAMQTVRQANGIAVRNFRPRVQYLHDGVYISLSNMRGISDISALEGLPVSVFEAHRTGIEDLTVLRNAPLRKLIISETKIASLLPILRCPLEYLNLNDTVLKSHSELVRIPTLRRLVLGGEHIKKLDFLRKTKLTELTVEDARIKDLSYLRDLPLRKLTMRRCGQLSSLRPLRDLKTLQELTFDHSKVKDLTPLRELKLERINLSYTHVASFNTLKKLDLVGLDVSGTPFRNLSGFEHLKLDTLSMNDTPIRKLEGIEKMPLVYLRIANTKITDLSLLEGKKLRTLHIYGTGVKDISALKGMPLYELRMENCRNLTDISVLKDSKTLQRLTIPKGTQDYEFLKTMPTLRNLDTKYVGWWRTSRNAFFGIGK